MSNYLFEEFEGISANAWKQKIQVDLKGADYNETLLWKTDEGITVKPFYTKEDRNSQTIAKQNKKFLVCQTITIVNEKEANQFAVDSIKRGATALHFIANKSFDYKELLHQLNETNISFYFSFGFIDEKLSSEIATYLKNSSVYFNTDCIGKLAATGNWYDNLTNDFNKLETQNNLVNQAIHVNASIYQNAGANIVQQLTYALAHANEYLNKFGAETAKNIHFNFAVGSNYFFEIAKLRAFRILWKALLDEYNIQSEAHIFAQPSLRNKTLYDYNVNMLRTTSECMSAILGGADTVSNTAYDALFHNSNEFGERISRNQLLILQEESEMAQAANIADGAYYIDSITQQLAEKALEIFKLIEQAGGFLQQLKNGTIQRKITEAAQKEQERFNNGELVLLGTNKIQNENDKMKNDLERHPFVKIRKEKTIIQPIIQKRLAEQLEQERLQNE